MPKTRHGRRTKIVATLGPASSDRAVIWSLFEAGVDVFRLNASHASHGTHDDHTARYETLRVLEREASHPIAVLICKARSSASASSRAAAPRCGTGHHSAST